MSDVIDLDGERNKPRKPLPNGNGAHPPNGAAAKAKKVDKPAAVARKPTKAELFGHVANRINGFDNGLPEFPHRFDVVELERGVREVLEHIEPAAGVVAYVSEEAVVNAILSYSVVELDQYGNLFKWTHSDAVNCMRFWRAITPPIAEPPAVRWKDEPGLTFSRLPWTFSPGETGDRTPLFNELLGRISNAPALVEFIGSLFDPKADRQQYCWLYGSGQNGKGCLSRFLERVFGRSYRAMQPPAQHETHWTAGLLGARLVVFPDCNQYGFPATGTFKMLTGGDAIPINPKHKPAFSAKLNAKYMFLSNERPKLSSETADLRRAIYCELMPISDAADPTYEARLWEEGGAFLSACIELYRAACPLGGQIKTDRAELDEIVALAEEDHQALAEKVFAFSPELSVSQSDWASWARTQFKDFHRKREFMGYLERKHGISFLKSERVNKRADGKICKFYKGFAFKAGAVLEGGFVSPD